jgi:hypothetical protein
MTKEDDEALAKRMMMRFEGYAAAHGGYDPDATITAIFGGKIEIKSTAYTKRAPVTLALWQRHLKGTTPLGIIPIRDNNTCLWGVIDIDDYGVDVPELLRQMKKEKLPLIACASKSGGVHLFLFLSKPIEANVVQFRLKEIAALLGHGNSEVFPKQQRVDWARGDMGSWLNMPYFGDTRHAYNEDGKTFMSLPEFLDLADSLAQPPEWLLKKGSNKTKTLREDDPNADPEFTDGPPCLQHLAKVGLGEGSRNMGLFQYGIFAKKKFGSKWKDAVERWNRDFVRPPLPSAEVVDILNRLEKKTYYYGCKEHPIVAHCNSALCRTRKHGVASGGEHGLPIIGGLSVLCTDPPVWFVDVNDTRIEFLTEDLILYRNFQRIVGRKIFIFFDEMKQSAWSKILNSLTGSEGGVTKIEVSSEAGLPGQFVELLEDFITNTNFAETRDDILLKRTWLDDSDEKDYRCEACDGTGVTVKTKDICRICRGDTTIKKWKFYFRLKDLQNYLTDANFTTHSRGQIVTRIRALGGDHAFFWLKGKKGTNVWWVPYTLVGKQPAPAQPPQPPAKEI